MRTKKRVLFLTSFWPYPDNDGGRNVATSILEAFKKHAHVDIVAFIQEDVFRPKFAHLKDFVENEVNLVQFRRKNARKVLLFWLRGKSYYFFRDYSPAYKEAIMNLLEGEKAYDYVVVDRAIPLVYIDWLKKKLRGASKFIYFSHNVESNLIRDYIINEKSFVRRILKTPLWVEYVLTKNFEQAALPLFDEVYSISYFDAHVFKTWGVDNVYVYPPAFFKGEKILVKDLRAEERLLPKIKLISNFKWYPNAEGLVWFVKEVWPLVLNKMPNANLILGGKSFAPWAKKVLLNAPNVFIEGYIPVDKVKIFYSDAALTIAPILSGSGLKIKVLRAFQYGVPLVATTKALEGFVKDIFEFVPNSNRPSEFASLVIKYLKFPRLRFNLRIRMNKYFERKLDRKYMDKFIQKVLSK